MKISYIRGALVCALVLAGLILGARGFVGWQRSPLNAEGWFAVALLLLTVAQPLPAVAAQKRRSTDRAATTGSGRAAFASLLVLVAVAFAPAVGSYFLSDDFLIVRYANEYHFSLRAFATAGGDGFFRPIANLSLGLTAPWAGFDPLRWHLAALAIHALNTLLVYFLARELRFDHVPARVPAWFAAAVFALHGTRPEAVVWIAGRFDAQAAFFALSALVLYLRSHARLALGAMVLGILSKESAYAIPALIALLPPPTGDSGWRNRARLSGPFFAIAGALFAYRWVLFGNVGGYLDASGSPQVFSVGVVSIVRTLAFRVWAILFFPINWSWQPGVALGLAVLAYDAALGWLAWSRTRREMLLVPVGFVLIASVPALQQLLIGADLEKSRNLYLPAVGFCLLLAALAASASPRLRSWACAAVLVFHGAALWHNLGAWNYAASKSRPACVAAASCARENGPRILAAGLPRSLNGVYFFANGFPACVEAELAGAKAEVEMRDALPPPEQSAGYACVLSWDPVSTELRRQGVLPPK